MSAKPKKFVRYFLNPTSNDEDPNTAKHNIHKSGKITKKKDVKGKEYPFKKAKLLLNKDLKTAKPDRQKDFKGRKNSFKKPKLVVNKTDKPERPIPYNLTKIKTGIHKKKLEAKGKKINYLTDAQESVKSLLLENEGFLEADLGETTTQFTQKEIVQSVDITAASKQFELHLRDFGPYRAKYTRNGRHLLLGGKMGHVSAIDWVTKKLHCELNVMESVHDVSWLHIETMIAVAQKKWVYIYDNQGLELHCVKKLHSVSRLEFLPYHFLLASASTEGYLSWLDISIGEMVTQMNTNLGRLMYLTHNPYNAVLCVGHAKGVVSMWTPNSRQPVAKMLCHKGALTSLHVDPSGTNLVTSSVARDMKIWDIRQLRGPVKTYTLNSVASNVAFSQRNLLAVSMGNIVEIYRDSIHTSSTRPYLLHKFNNPIENLSFCPFEDVLGVATDKGFTSLLIPGAGEANYDGFDANPFQTKSQRREHEVKTLLEKIQPELISLQPNMVSDVDVGTMKQKVMKRREEMKAGNRKFKLQQMKVDQQRTKGAKGKKKRSKREKKMDKKMQEKSSEL